METLTDSEIDLLHNELKVLMLRQNIIWYNTNNTIRGKKTKINYNFEHDVNCTNLPKFSNVVTFCGSYESYNNVVMRYDFKVHNIIIISYKYSYPEPKIWNKAIFYPDKENYDEIFLDEVEHKIDILQKVFDDILEDLYINFSYNDGVFNLRI